MQTRFHAPVQDHRHAALQDIADAVHSALRLAPHTVRVAMGQRLQGFNQRGDGDPDAPYVGLADPAWLYDGLGDPSTLDVYMAGEFTACLPRSFGYLWCTSGATLIGAVVHLQLRGEMRTLGWAHMPRWKASPISIAP